MRTGLDVFLDGKTRMLRGARVGLIVNPASVTHHLDHAIERFFRCDDFQLTALFSPEHGARGEAQDQVEVSEYKDDLTKLPVYSLYGATRIPTQEMLANVDVLVFDMQDVGSRYYTFIYTLAEAMRACARDGGKMVVLDRPNPINGVTVEGNVLNEKFKSFVGMYPLAVRHGMTPGELARMFNEEFGIGCELEVVSLEGWRRGLWYDETALPWVLPSPNMPTLDTATVYPGGCLIEGTNLSEGRGTTKPFELVGAPFIQPYRFRERLMEESLPGVIYRPVYFLPTFHKHQGRLCGGVQVHVVERREFKPFLTYLWIIQTAYHMYPDHFRWRQPPYEYETEKLPMDILCGDDRTRLEIEHKVPPHQMEQNWLPELEQFKEKREKYLLY